MEDIKNLNSSSVFYFFEQISKIPRGSGNEKQISDFLVDFAKKRNLWVHQDNALNVVIKKAATKGYETAPTLVIQGHMDMVCVKRGDVVHDFEKDPIKLIYEGDILRADGTTLGGDDGVAVAMALAILDSEEIEHPALEVVITTDEEVGMDGAMALDGSLIDGKILLNIDSEDEGVFTAGCAGGLKTTTEFEIEWEKAEDSADFYKINVGGLKGGHSGIDIDKERGNAIRLLARALTEINNSAKIKVSELFGGAKDNAIPSEAYGVITTENKAEAYEIISQFNEKIKNEFRNSDSNVFINIEETEKKEKVFSDKCFEDILKALLVIPNGVQSLSTDIENLPESSNNIGVLRTEENTVRVVCAVRSSVASKKYYILEQIKAVSLLANAKFDYRGDYPAWEFKQNSILRDKMVAIYKKMFNTEPVIDIIHAGLECGIFAKKIPDMDMISFGPNLMDIHSPEERMSISSCERTWNFLLEVIKSFK